jgi:tRNA uridine 5-carboxymethylaminomethyl modification enzyme
VEIAAKYQGYIDRQQEEIERSRHNEDLAMPDDLDYCEVRGLSIEAQQKLNKQQPQTLGQAGRVSGITPADISLLLVYLKKKYNSKLVSEPGKDAA